MAAHVASSEALCANQDQGGRPIRAFEVLFLGANDGLVGGWAATAGHSFLVALCASLRVWVA